MVTALNDPLNLRDYISFVVDHVKQYGSADLQPRTIVGFLSTVFNGADFREYLSGITDAARSVEQVVITLQKLFSGNVHYTKISKIADSIVAGTFDELLLNNLISIGEAIDSTAQPELFYSRLQQMVSRRFFTPAELDDIQKRAEHCEYKYVHLIILKHSMASLFNIPCFFADRMYEEALTYDFDSAMRYALMRTAAQNGSKRAALEYGNYIAKAGPYQEAFNYLLMALPLPAAIWNATYLIEKQQVGEEQEVQLRTALKVNEKIATSKEFDVVRNELDSIIYTGSNPADAQRVLFCYSAYFYLAYKGFYKAFNSMAKLLTDGSVCVYDVEWALTTTSLCEKYWDCAIAGGNITAISNLGNRQFRRMEAEGEYSPQAPNTQYTEELLTVAASMDFMRANYNLGNYYEFVAKHSDFPKKSQSEIESVYEHAAELDTDKGGVNSDLYFRIAQISTDRKKKQRSYEKALSLGKHDAAYYLALMGVEDYESERTKYILLKSQRYLVENEVFFSSPLKPYVEPLKAEIDAHLCNDP